MLLTMDIGNTAVKLGLFDGTQLHLSVRVSPSTPQTAKDWAECVSHVLTDPSFGRHQVHATIIASVVPAITKTMVAMVRRELEHDPHVVDAHTRTGMPILCDSPSEVGVDRIVNAVAAYDDARCGVIVVDFGTATTFDCVNPHGAFVGGAIVPGIEISEDGLFRRTANLHRVDIAVPPGVVGRNTTHAIQSGLTFGYASLVDGMLSRIRQDVEFPCVVWATGGLASMISKLLISIDHVDTYLTLKGLRLIHERNRPA